MTGCCIPGCTNRSEAGYAMKILPTDRRRELWVNLIQEYHKNWVPKKYSRICEVHFEPNMWEGNNKKRLKFNAFPTLNINTNAENPNCSASKKTIVSPSASRKVTFNLNDNTDHSYASLNIDSDVSGPHSSSPSTSASSKSTEIDFNMKSFEDNRHKLITLKKKYIKLFTKYKFYRKQYYEIKKTIKTSTNHKHYELIKKIFNPDQLKALQRKNMKFMKWDQKTIAKALKLKFTCGSVGYNEIIKQNIPLPALRTLRHNLQRFKFDTGILDEVITIMKIKIENFKHEHEKDCSIFIDEMAISPSLVYDNSLKKMLGYVSLSEQEGIVATHAMVIMLGGISTRWKQTVAYHFTGDSIDAVQLQNLLFEIIRKVEEIELNVRSITTDMGPSNQKLWKIWNVKANRSGYIKNYIQHPSNPDKKIYIFADVPHLFKNIKNMLMNNSSIVIDSTIAKKFNISTTIQAEHIRNC